MLLIFNPNVWRFKLSNLRHFTWCISHQPQALDGCVQVRCRVRPLWQRSPRKAGMNAELHIGGPGVISQRKIDQWKNDASGKHIGQNRAGFEHFFFLLRRSSPGLIMLQWCPLSRLHCYAWSIKALGLDFILHIGLIWSHYVLCAYRM